MSGLRDWADLPDGLLHSIIPLLGSFHDLLSFAATCRPWHSAFISYPSKSTLYTLFPPLLLQPNVSFCSPRPFQNVVSNTFVPTRPCHVTDLASQDTQPCSQIPLITVGENATPSALDNFALRGASFGHMIFSHHESCFVFDAFTGISVSPPPLPIETYTEIHYGAALTAPLASPNSHLIVSTESNFVWRVGSNTWLKCSRNRTVKNIVVFNGQVFGIGSDRKLFMVHLVPQIRIQEIPIAWGGSNSMTKWHLAIPWLVACGDMLLMVGSRTLFPGMGGGFEAYRLDMSGEPAKWVKVETLGNWAIFIINDKRSQALSCMNPERWGGRSNCIYCYDAYDSGSGDTIAFELGKPLHEDDASEPNVCIYTCTASRLLPMWVVPSMFCS